jgi:SAM-dependent methyltransferase
MPSPAAPEETLSLDTLLRLRQQGLAGLPRLRALCLRGDWRARALAVSALGEIVRDDPSAWRVSPFRHRVAKRLPILRDRFPSTGPRGEFARGELVNALVDRAWIVRTAAALAVGECRDARLAPPLQRLLQDHYRPVRVAAASALAASGAPPAAGLEEVVAGSEPAPPRIGDTSDSREWLQRLAAAHPRVLQAWGASPPRDSSPAAWAARLAGEAAAEHLPDPQAEILRYAQEKEAHYNVTKPFTPGHRDQNVRLLHSFLVVAEQMRVPQRGLVLDLGGGAGWVSELLAKLGYRPVTLDIASALLRVGRDRFTRENLTARFAAGDMTALPFAAGAFEAAVVIDALHHVPDVAAVFREAHRVLVQGGQFLLAEAGEGHAETEKSRAEMGEFGVCEAEIHLFEAVRYAREAGFDDVRVVPHAVPGLSMTPEDLRAAMSEPPERWRVRHEGRETRYDEYLFQSVFCHPVLVCSKGERPLDSRAPRTLRAGLEAHLQREGARVWGHVRVANQGDTRWLCGGDEAGRVRLGIQLMTPERKLVQLDFARAMLPRDVEPGQVVDVAVEVTLPDGWTPYVLKLDPVDEHVCWFEDGGSKPLYLAV